MPSCCLSPKAGASVVVVVAVAVVDVSAVVEVWTGAAVAAVESGLGAYGFVGAEVCSNRSYKILFSEVADTQAKDQGKEGRGRDAGLGQLSPNGNKPDLYRRAQWLTERNWMLLANSRSFYTQPLDRLL